MFCYQVIPQLYVVALIQTCTTHKIVKLSKAVAIRGAPTLQRSMQIASIVGAWHCHARQGLRSQNLNLFIVGGCFMLSSES